MWELSFYNPTFQRDSCYSILAPRRIVMSDSECRIGQLKEQKMSGRESRESLQDFVSILLLASKNPVRTSNHSEKRMSSAREIVVVRAIGFKAVK